MDYFRAIQVDKGITCIKGFAKEMMYLIEGNKSAVLIDAGLGLGNLKEYISHLTTLPYQVLLSHGHLDHIGGAFLYDTVYLNPADEIIFYEHSPIHIRKTFVAPPVKKQNVVDSDFTSVSDVDLKPLQDGDLFDLGGVTIEAIATPGHTPGSMSFLLKEHRILFTGDACNSYTYLFLDHSLTVEDYQKSVKRILNRQDEYDQVYLSHMKHEMNKSVVQDVYDCCEDIKKGQADDVPFRRKGYSDIYIAKKVGKTVKRTDGKLGNIIYRKANVFNT